MSRFSSLVILCIFLVMLGVSVTAQYNPSYSPIVKVTNYPFYDSTVYDPSIPTPISYFGEPIGKWPLHYYEFIPYLKNLDEISDRIMMESHGVTYEGRELYHLFISTPENLAKLETCRKNMARIADPEINIPATELNRLIAEQPAFARMGYGVHGDETSPPDAAVYLAYHLAAAEDSATLNLLKNVIIILDPTHNPDGRERYLSMLETYRGHVPNYDIRDASHSGVWPWGRTNHYLFDLNRDYCLVTQPETIGRVRNIVEYNPVLVVDGHEMGPNSTFLFSPPRQPINYNTPENIYKWYETFRKDHASRLDQFAWPYYNKEWNDQWYVGYGSSWPTFMGAVGILYEQAWVHGAFVLQKDKYLLTYHESVNHIFQSSLANLYSVANNREALLKDYRQARANIVKRGRQEGLKFIFTPDKDIIKMNRFINSLLVQGIKVQRATADFTVGRATDIYGNIVTSKEFPAGSFIVSTAQPQGALAKAILEFDLHLKLDFLKEERRELEKYNETRMYEISAWSVPMGYNLDAYETDADIKVSTEPVSELRLAKGKLHNPDAIFGYILDMVGEQTYLALNELRRENITVYVSTKPFTLEGRSYQPGALVLRKLGNPEKLNDVLYGIAEKVGIDIYGVNTGLSLEGSQLGAETFAYLPDSRIAMLTGSPLDYTAVGSAWFTLDRQLDVPLSLIQTSEAYQLNLSDFNVLIIPSNWGPLGSALPSGFKSQLNDWIKSGGTLLLYNRSAYWAADSSNHLSRVSLKRQSLDKLKNYSRSLMKELAAESPDVDTMSLWHPDKVTESSSPADNGPSLGKEQLEELDSWQRRFHPRGVIMRVDLDREHWLNFGLGKSIPAMSYTSRALLSETPVETPARYCTDKNKLRMAGLLWPEARERWSGTAFATVERLGKGQVIMLADEPNFRAYFYGPRQMFVNAVMFGPAFTGSMEDYQNQ